MMVSESRRDRRERIKVRGHSGNVLFNQITLVSSCSLSIPAPLTMKLPRGDSSLIMNYLQNPEAY